MKTALVDDDGIVQNFIVIDDDSGYEPPEGQAIQQVNNWVDIGQATNVAEPQPPAPPVEPQPTKAELLAKINILIAQVNALT